LLASAAKLATGKPTSLKSGLFRQPTPLWERSEWNLWRSPASFQGPVLGSCSRGSPGAELLQFEAIRMVAASLIGVSIVLLWFVAMTSP
jgi:hypothetical protein